MSGFLPDLASWALGGGAGNVDANGNPVDNPTTDEQSNDAQQPSLTEAEIRARRLARMTGGAAGTPTSSAGGTTSQGSSSLPQPMDVDSELKPSPSKASPVAMKVDTEMEDRKPAARPSSATGAAVHQTQVTASKSTLSSTPRSSVPTPKKMKTLSPAESSGRKLQKKKELVLKKVLKIALAGSTTSSSVDSNITVIDVGHQVISTQSVADILSTRLAEVSASSDTSSDKGVITYLGLCHKRASEEHKTWKQMADTKRQPEVEQVLEEIQRQTVSFAASTLMVPDLFPMGKDATQQLFNALVKSQTDSAASITFGVSGKDSSFYHRLCDELYSQDEEVFHTVFDEVLKYLCEALKALPTLLDSKQAGSAVPLTSTLTSMCAHDKVLLSVVQNKKFLLPAAGTPEASEGLSPQEMLRMMTQGSVSRSFGYLKRSGPALEMDTILGLVVRLGCPYDEESVLSAFPSTLMVSQDAVDKVANHQRRQLQTQQAALHQLFQVLMRGGSDKTNRETIRALVMKWLTDALLVNANLTAFRPDPKKVSKVDTVINLSAVLLKLCEPVMNDPKKVSLIHPGFVSSEADHGGVYAMTGDDAIPRLGENPTPPSEHYDPKNKFVPRVFFFAARSLTLGFLQLASTHKGWSSTAGRMYHEIRDGGGDPSSNPNYLRATKVAMATEVALFQEDLVNNVLRFCNLMAGFLMQIDDASLRLMPEQFVDDICEILTFFVQMRKSKFLVGHAFRPVFQLIVKFLSPKYASLVRNYNLRAKLGDCLHDIFVPSGGDRRDRIPASIYTDPLAGGQTYLLSDKECFETLAPSLLLLYGEVEHTGYYEMMTHRSNISTTLKYLWESREHRPAFRRITQDQTSFIKFANGIMNETNSQISGIMEKLMEIKATEDMMANAEVWGALSEEDRETRTQRRSTYQSDLRKELPYYNKAIQMLGFLNTDEDIRKLFINTDMTQRNIVNMLLHVLTKLVGARGLDLKVQNPQELNFHPKEMLRDMCAIFALFADRKEFQTACAESGYYNEELIAKAVQTCQKHHLLTGASMESLLSLPASIKAAADIVAHDESLFEGAPDEFFDELVLTVMKDPVKLPTSGRTVDRSTIEQHLLNDTRDPFNREELTLDMLQPDVELKRRITEWVEEKSSAMEQG